MNYTLFHDRENDLSIANYTVQLFTVPTIAEFLVTHTRMISSIFHLLKGFFLGDSIPEDFKPQADLLGSYKSASTITNSIFPRMTCESDIVRNRKYWHLFQDVRYVLSNEVVKKKLFRKYPEHLKDFLDLLVIFQGMQPQQRSIQVHVEYETDHWVHALNLAIQLSLMIRQVGDCFSVSDDDYNKDFLDLVAAIKKTVVSLSTWCLIDHVKETLVFKNQTKCLSSHFDHPYGFSMVQFGDQKYQLPEFKVSLQRVSLYDPLHCLLAELLSKLPKVLENMPDQTSASHMWNSVFSEDIIGRFQIEKDLLSYSPHLESIKNDNVVALLFDYPIRIIVMLSQIRAGIWVRNGYMMRNQAQHFREVMLREWYDSNLLIIQTGASVLSPSLFLVSLVERFELSTWLDFGKPVKIDLAQLASINEDMLQVLIYILSERSKILGLPHAHDLRREIIHHLGSSKGLQYSELKKRIPERLLESSGDLEQLDEILDKVSNFKFPENFSDQGVYVLQDEYYAQLDPWFWHLSRSERDFLDAALKRRADEAIKRGITEFNLPALMPLSSSCCHMNILSLFNDSAFCQIIFFSIWHSTKRMDDSGEEATPGDHVLNASIHLILLGISESKNPDVKISLDSFYRNLSSNQYKIKISDAVRLTTCLELICSLVDRANEDDIREHARALRFIISQIELYGVDSALRTISGWRDKSRWSFGHKIEDETDLTKESDALTEKERKKIAAKKRQQQILAQFESAQKSFMANYGEELNYNDDDSVMEISTENFSTPPEQRPDQCIMSFPSGPCIVCQEDASTVDGRVYGALGLIQASYLEKKFQFSEKDEFFMSAHTSETFSKFNLPQKTSMGVYSSSCGHLMHNSCFNTYIQSIESRHTTQPTRNHPEDGNHREFLCPLCKTFGNALFPITNSSYLQFANWFGSEQISEGYFKNYREKHSKPLDQWWQLRGQIFQDIVDCKLLITPSVISKEEKDYQIDQNSGTSNFRNYISRVVNLGCPSVRYSEEVERAFDENWIPAVEYACDTLELSLLGIEPNYILSYTISCIEIAIRGMTSDTANTGGIKIPIINCLNSQTASFLPVFVSTMQSYTRICLQETDFCSAINHESVHLFTCLFSGILNDIHTVSIPAILYRDSFQVLVHIVQVMDLISEKSISDLFSWIRICWMLEITKMFSSFVLNGSSKTDLSSFFLENTVMADIYSSLNISLCDALSETQLEKLVALCETTGLIFLRRTTLLCFSFFGMVPPTGKHGLGFDLDTQDPTMSSESSELTDLLVYLSLPSVKQLLLTKTNESSIERALIKSWIHNSRDELLWTYFPAPIAFKLVDLPQTYDDLFEICRNFVCPNCNQKPHDPAICLICGEIVCSQSYCCLKDGFGECNQHAKK